MENLRLSEKKSVGIVVILALSLIPLPGLTQTLVNPDLPTLTNQSNANYFSIEKDVEAYYKANPVADSIEGSGLNSFNRWKWFWSTRSSAFGETQGDFQPYLKAILQTQQSQVFCAGNTTANWTNLGPLEMPEQVMGVVYSVAVNPNNYNIMYAGTGSGGLWRSTNAITGTPPTWTNITDYLKYPSLGVTRLQIDPMSSSTIYAATGNQRQGYGLGVLKSTDFGSTWFETELGWDPSKNYTIRELAFDPSNSQTVYALTNTEVFKTTNGGDVDWPSLNLQAEANNNNLRLGSIAFDESDPDVFVVGGWGALWRYDPSTTPSWTNVTSNLAATTDPKYYVVVSSTSDGIFVIYRTIPSAPEACGGGPSGVIRIDQSTDGGLTWFCITLSDRIAPLFVVSPSNSDIMYLSDIRPGRVVTKSIDGGATFYPVSKYSAGNLMPNGTSTHADIRDLRLVSSSSDGLSDVVIVGNDGGVLFSDNATESGGVPAVNWTNVNGHGLAITEFYGFGTTERGSDMIVGGTQDNGEFTHINGAWDQIYQVFGDAFDGIIDLNSTQRMYGQGNYTGLGRSTNQGVNWSFLTPPEDCPVLEDCGNVGFRTRPMEFAINNRLLLAHYDVWKFNLNTSLWEPISDFQSLGVPRCLFIEAMDVSQEDANVIYVAFRAPTYNADMSTCTDDCSEIVVNSGKSCTDCNGSSVGTCLTEKLYKTTDGGITWTDKTSDLEAVRWSPITDIVIDPNNDERLWVTFGEVRENPFQPGEGLNRVAYSGDGGTTWTYDTPSGNNLSDGLPMFPANTIKYQNGTNDGLYIGTDVGVYYKDASMSEWECYDDNFPIALITDLEISYCDEKIYAATFGRGVWESPLAVSGATTVTVATEWTSTVILKDDLIIEPGIVLTVSSRLSLEAGKELRIKQGGVLIIDGGELKNVCNPGTYANIHLDPGALMIVRGGSEINLLGSMITDVHAGAELIVENGSKLILEESTQLGVSDFGLVRIESGAVLEYHDCVFKLGGSEAVLDIRGVLEIADNTTFTFQPGNFGCGYVKFTNNPFLNANVIGGTNSEFVLDNICTGSKVLEIANGSLLAHVNLNRFKITQGVIEYSGSSADLVIPGFGVLIQVEHITTTAPFGRLITFGQQTMIINQCQFRGVSVHGWHFWGGNGLTISHSLIENNYLGNGLEVYGGGVHLNNVFFDGNSVGMMAVELEYPSTINNCQFTGHLDLGMVFYSGGGTSVSLENTQVDGNHFGGIIAEDTDLRIKCSSISNNYPPSGKPGLWLTNNAKLRMGTTTGGGYVDLSNNRISIKCSNAYSIDIALGYNNLVPNTSTSYSPPYYSILGSVIDPGCSNPNLLADNNLWGPLSSDPPGTLPLTLLSVDNCSINVQDASPGTLAACGTMDVPCPGPPPCNQIVINNCPSCPIISTPDFNGVALNDAIKIAISNTELKDDTKDDIVAVDMFHQILTASVNMANPDVVSLVNLAYSHMKNAVANAFANDKITEADNLTQLHSTVQQLVDVQDTLSDSITLSNFRVQLYLAMDKAHTYRLAEKRDVAKQILEDADNCLLTEDDRKYLRRRISLIEIEASIIDGQVSFDQLDSLFQASGLTAIPTRDVIDTTVVFDSTVTIGTGTSIGSGAQLGTGVTVGNGVDIEDNVTIENNVSISDGTSIGESTTIQMNTTIGENTAIAENVEIAKDATIGNNVNIGDNVHISKNVVIGNNVCIEGGVFLKKDINISDGACLMSNTRIGIASTIGTNAIIGNGSRLGNDVLIGDESIIEAGVSINNGAETGTGAVIYQGTTVGVNASVCDGEITSGNISNNGSVGSCVSPTAPTEPSSVIIDCHFALTRAEMHQNFLNGFTVTAHGSDTLCVGKDIRFTPNTFSNQIFWDFGDCNTSSEISPQHSYTRPGIYIIKLVQDLECTLDTLIGAISVFPSPTPAFMLSTSCDQQRNVTISRSVDVGDFTTSFCIQPIAACNKAALDTSRLRVKYNWDFGFNAFPPIEEFFTITQVLSGAGDDFVLTYPIDSTYDISITTTLQVYDLHDNIWEDFASCSNTFTQTYKATDQLSAGFNKPIKNCVDEMATFSNATSGGSEPIIWSWDFGDGQQSTDENPTNTYLTSGLFEVTLVASDKDGCPDTSSANITVLPSNLVLGFSFQNNGLTYSFIDQSVGGSSFAWDFGDGFNSFIASPNHTYEEFGTYFVCQVVANSCGLDSFCQEIVVGPSVFQKAYGGSATDRGRGIITTADGGYASRGYTNSFGAGNRDALLMKTDAQGNLLWSKVYGGTNVDDAKSVQQTTDGGYILVGRTSSFGNALRKGLTVKTDFEGNVIWSKVFSTPSANVSFSVIRELSGGGYMLVGNTDEGTGDGQILLVQLDAQGNKVFAKAIGGSGNRFARHLELTNDGGYLILGDTRTGTDIDILIIKTDASGTINWSRTYSGLLVDFGQSSKEIEMLCSNGGGFVISGRTNSQGAGSNDGMMLKVDELGNVLWAKTYGGAGSENFSTVKEEAGTHNLLSCGVTTSFGSGLIDVYLVKTDNLGNLIESKTFGGTGNDNSVGNDDSFQITPDGGVVISAATSSFGSGGDDLYIIKTDASGSSGCNEVTPVATQVANATVVVNTVTLPVTSTSLNAVSHTLSVSSPAIVETTICPLPQAKMGNTGGGKEVVSSVETPEIIGDPESYIRSYPNPFSDKTTIEFSMTSTEKITVEIHSVSGERVALLFDAVAVEGSTYKVAFDAAELSGGIYFYTLRSASERITEKLVVIK